MRIGFNLLVIGGHIDETHAGVLEEIKRRGYDGIEVPIFEGSHAHYKALGRLTREIGLAATAVSIVTEETNPLLEGEAAAGRARDRLAWAIDCCAALGADLLAGPFHSPVGHFSGAGPSESELERCAARLREAAEYGASAGVKLSFEPLNRFECYLVNTLDQAADLKRRVGHPNLDFMYDTFHANIEERDPVAAYATHRGEIGHIHISENDRGIPGRGHVPWNATFRVIRAGGYEGWLTVEAFGRALPALAGATRVWRDLFPDRDTLIAESIAFIRRSWEAAGEA
ncbi:D-psicose/D-tagatose/L-ribulose 3-epimerase [Rhizobiales bacterium GAS188]|nr:D-psicose/D-tagatose/L-ribulose 3-epimerase [Rhizobiales bacterium GAS188]